MSAAVIIEIHSRQDYEQQQLSPASPFGKPQKNPSNANALFPPLMQLLRGRTQGFVLGRVATVNAQHERE